MKPVPLKRIIEHCEHRLRPESYKDYDRAWNGLQVENDGTVRRIAAAVDASKATVELALAAKADLLLVHHGLFWNGTVPWTGRRYQLLRRLIEGNLAVYSQHLPLDGHPTLGNAAQLARALGFRSTKPFFEHHGQHLGVSVRLPRPMDREELNRKLSKILGGTPVLLRGGAATCRHIGICTGGAGSELAQAAREGVDTFISGEGPHWSHGLAEDLGLNVFLGGHYATETFGVRALAAELSETFGIEWTFLDHPSGL